MLEHKGALVVDVDQISRSALEVGSEAWAEVVGRFGSDVLRPDGSVDRKGLAALVFSDASARRDLETIVHPRVLEGVRRALAVASPSAVVVLDIPLLAELAPESRPDSDAVVVVDTTSEAALERLVSQRGMSPREARERMSAQVGRSERLAMADYVIENSSDMEHLSREVDEAWQWVLRLASRHSRAGEPSPDGGTVPPLG